MDRTAKLLLALLAGGLWAVALRPLLMPTPVQAQDRGAAYPAQLLVSPNGNVYTVRDSTLSVYTTDRDPATGRIRLQLQDSTALLNRGRVQIVP